VTPRFANTLKISAGNKTRIYTQADMGLFGFEHGHGDAPVVPG
jgi:hypothetical protein